MTALLLDAGNYSLDDATLGGIGLRVAELAAALAHHFPVFVYAPATADREPVDLGAAELVTDPADWPRLLADASAVFFFDMPDRDRLEHACASGTLIVSENAPPIEQLDYPSLRRHGGFDQDTYRHLVDTYRRQLASSELFIARSRIERITLIATLCAYGLLTADDLDRSRLLDHRVVTIPIGFRAAALPTASRRTPSGLAREVLWTGGLWTFTDPVAAVRGIAAARTDGVDVSLRFLHAAPHPDTAGTRAAVTRAAEDLGVAEHVVLHTDPVRHSDRDRYFRQAAGLICLTRPGIENQTCVRLRARDARLYGLTMLVDPHGATATELGADGLAVAVDPHDTAALAGYLAVLVSDRPPRPVRAEEWVYEHTTAPLVALLHEHLK